MVPTLPDQWWSTIKGCEVAYSMLKQAKAKAHVKFQAAYDTTEKDAWSQRIVIITTALSEVMDRKRILSDSTRASALQIVLQRLKERWTKDEYLQVWKDAEAAMEQRKEYTWERGVGSAIGVLATGGGMRTRA